MICLKKILTQGNEDNNSEQQIQCEVNVIPSSKTKINTNTCSYQLVRIPD